MKDLDFYKIANIDSKQLNDLVFDKMEELYLDYGQKVDDQSITHLVKRVMEILNSQYRQWAWGDFCAVCKLGLAGTYGPGSRISVQSIASWLKKAEDMRRQRNGDRSCAEGQIHKNEDKHENYAENAKRWMPLIFLRLSHGIYLERPEQLKQAIMNDELPPAAMRSLAAKYPQVFTVKYPEI